MATFRLRYSLEAVDGAATTIVGNAQPPLEFELDNPPTVVTFSVPADDTVIAWEPAAGGAALPDDFTLLVLVAEAPVEVEFTTSSASANRRAFAMTLEAGVPFVLGSSAGRDNYAQTDAFAGTAASIDKIRLANLDTEDAAAVTMVLGKLTSS